MKTSTLIAFVLIDPSRNDVVKPLQVFRNYNAGDLLASGPALLFHRHRRRLGIRHAVDGDLFRHARIQRWQRCLDDGFSGFFFDPMATGRQRYAMALADFRKPLIREAKLLRKLDHRRLPDALVQLSAANGRQIQVSGLKISAGKSGPFDLSVSHPFPARFRSEAKSRGGRRP